MQIAIAIVIAFFVGVVLTWIYKDRAAALLRKENDALKTAAAKASSKL